MLFYATVNKCTLSLSRFLRRKKKFYQFFSTKGQDRKTRQCGGSCRPPTFRFHFAHQWSNSFSPRTQGRGTADQQFGICASVGYRTVSFFLGWASFCKSWKITRNVSFWFWHFPSIFVLWKLTCLVTLLDCNFQVFKNLSKLTIFYWTFVHSKCKRSSLRSLFLWFSSTV